MNNLPKKPAAVAHVSDTHWEAALRKSWNLLRESQATAWCNFEAVVWVEPGAKIVIDHARCLILLGEVVEPVDPIEAALIAMWNEPVASFGSPELFAAACRKHFAGLTFPEIG